MYTNKLRGSSSASKRIYTRVLALGSYKGDGARVARSHPFFLSTKSRSKLGYIAASCKIYCCITRCSFVFMLNRPQKVIGILVYKNWPLTIVLTIKKITQWQKIILFTQNLGYSEENLWCLQATFKYIFHLLSSRLFLRFVMLYFVSLCSVTGHLFYFYSWPGKNIYFQKTSRSLSELNDHPVKDTLLTEYFEFSPCYFSFYIISVHVVYMWKPGQIPSCDLSGQWFWWSGFHV
jgi:hypothetical protein